MSNCPGLYFDIGKKARDVLYKDYARQPKINEINYQGCDWSFDLSCKIQDIIPGVSSLVGLVIPHSGKVELQYMKDYFGATGGIGLKTEPVGVFSPILNFSGVVGTSLFSFGTGFSFDLGTREFDKFDTGLSFANDLLASSLTLDKLDTLKASCYYKVNPLTKTAIAAELKHSFSTSDTSLSVGAQHAFMPLTVLKGKVDTHGKVAAMIQQGLWDKLFLSIGGKLDFMDQRRIPNIGLSMAIKV
ncbi:mitochondrial outer membrane protein porin of 36 kDa-like isoform X1 [Humulus lupulus]|uniref:mitochondrial outer membrane protein porin of 36 kDa-like isoform X1 n=1 Tax=Humulus lupulus TaxID=3486 RepID=UPI002B4014A5|nr:mitochondrial outer membrane protein porin of 36 kDa-like isoform X1 [Humulus lupulus]